MKIKILLFVLGALFFICTYLYFNQPIIKTNNPSSNYVERVDLYYNLSNTSQIFIKENGTFKEIQLDG